MSDQFARISYSYRLADLPEPSIKTAKQWRRYQVMLKRMQQSIDDHFMRPPHQRT